MANKICTKCKIEYPKNNEFFTLKITKPSVKNKLINISYTFSYQCRVCLKETVKEKRNKATAKKLNISYEEYKDNIKKYKYIQSSQKTIKYNNFDRSNLTKSQRNNITERLRKGDSLEMALFGYKKRALENKRKAVRKCDYKKSLEENITTKERDDYRRTHLHKSYVASCYKIPVKKLSDELYETLKQKIILKRKLKTYEQSKICN